MSIELLKHLRFLTPGIIIVIFWSFLGSTTGDWRFELPDSISEVGSYLPAIVAAAIYYLTPLRNWANRKHLNAINENLRYKLVEIGGGRADSPCSQWPNLHLLFYNIVDSDESLKIHAKHAYFNGYLWTTVADFKAISLFFAAFALLYHFLFSSQGALCGFGCFAGFALVSWPVGGIVTRKHKSIGDKQLAIIEQFHKDQVTEYFAEDG